MPPARQRLAVLTALAAGVGHAAAFSTDDVSDLSTGAWIGIGVAVLLVLVLFITCCCCCCRRRRQPKSDNHYTAAPHQDAPAPMSNPADYYTVDMYPPRAATPGKSNGGQTTQQTYQSTGGQSWTSAGSAPSGGMWDDPTIVAARIPFEHVQLGELLSRGGFGEVYRGMYRSEKVAIKTLLPATRKDLKSIEAFLGEIKLMASLEHECIVRFIGVAWESLSQLYAVSEFMDGGDLRSLLVEFQAANHAQGFDADKARMAKQVAHGLTYLHSLEPIMLHRDLKSRNILLTAQLDARITDFGTTRENSDKTMTAGVGTSLWMAPEVIMGERYGDKADVFSLGVVLAELDSHELPYAHATQTDTGRPLPETAVLQLVVLGRLRVAVSGRSSPEVNQLIDACVDLEPANRPTAAEVLYRLHTIAKTL